MLSKISDLLIYYQEQLYSAQKMMESERDFGGKLLEMADELDKKTNDLRGFINEYALFLPEKILIKVLKFNDKVTDSSDSEKYTLDDSDRILNSLHDQLWNIIELCRIDIGVEKLNEKLENRIHK